MLYVATKCLALENEVCWPVLCCLSLCWAGLGWRNSWHPACFAGRCSRPGCKNGGFGSTTEATASSLGPQKGPHGAADSGKCLFWHSSLHCPLSFCVSILSSGHSEVPIMLLFVITTGQHRKSIDVDGLHGNHGTKQHPNCCHATCWQYPKFCALRSFRKNHTVVPFTCSVR